MHNVSKTRLIFVFLLFFFFFFYNFSEISTPISKNSCNKGSGKRALFPVCTRILYDVSIWKTCHYSREYIVNPKELHVNIVMKYFNLKNSSFETEKNGSLNNLENQVKSSDLFLSIPSIHHNGCLYSRLHS